MSELLGDGFVELRCCGDSIGFVNARSFTAQASARFCALQQKLGNAWPANAETKVLIDDPASYGPPPDGTPILFSCGSCGARFTWIGGVPVQAAAT